MLNWKYEYDCETQNRRYVADGLGNWIIIPIFLDSCILFDVEGSIDRGKVSECRHNMKNFSSWEAATRYCESKEKEYADMINKPSAVKITSETDDIQKSILERLEALEKKFAGESKTTSNIKVWLSRDTMAKEESNEDGDVYVWLSKPEYVNDWMEYQEKGPYVARISISIFPELRYVIKPGECIECDLVASATYMKGE